MIPISNLEKSNWVNYEDDDEYQNNLIYLKEYEKYDYNNEDDDEDEFNEKYDYNNEDEFNENDFLDNILFDVMIEIIRENNQFRIKFGEM